jgi:hypothetical protein
LFSLSHTISQSAELVFFSHKLPECSSHPRRFPSPSNPRCGGYPPRGAPSLREPDRLGVCLWLHRYIGDDLEQVASYEAERADAGLSQKLYDLRTKAGLT